MNQGSITRYIPLLRAGDPEAVRLVWQRYFTALVELARRKIVGLPGWSTDAEDVALSAFNSFCGALVAEQFPRLEDRNDLWQVALVILQRKASDHRRHARRGKRDPAMVEALPDEQLADPHPNPEEAAADADELRVLLELLEEDVLQKLALLKLAGHTNQEVAASLGCGLRTVERKLERIRRIWEERGVE